MDSISHGKEATEHSALAHPVHKLCAITSSIRKSTTPSTRLRTNSCRYCGSRMLHMTRSLFLDEGAERSVPPGLGSALSSVPGTSGPGLSHAAAARLGHLWIRSSIYLALHPKSPTDVS